MIETLVFVRFTRLASPEGRLFTMQEGGPKDAIGAGEPSQRSTLDQNRSRSSPLSDTSVLYHTISLVHNSQRR